jgi:hypothetical protein
MVNPSWKPILLASSRSACLPDRGVDSCSEAVRGRRNPQEAGVLTTTVPFHKGRDISPPLLRQIVKDIGMTLEDFIALR